jgi:hypothetical protein
MDMTPADKQKLEVLNGDRGSRGDAALRLKHAQALVANLPVTPSGNTANDIAALFAAINALRVALL